MFLSLFLLAIILFMGMSSFSRKASRALSSSSTHSRRTAGPVLEEVDWENNGANAKIAIISLEGVIQGRSVESGKYGLVQLVRAQFAEAADDAHVKAVIFKIDSPGGEVLASDDISRIIKDFQRLTKKPVIACMGNLAASGGYYVAAPCRWIVANEMTITGSIGVIMSTYNYRGLMDKVGVTPVTFKSGRFKDMLSGKRDPKEIPPEEQAMMQSMIDETYSKFKRVVEDGREQAFTSNEKLKQKGRKLSADWANYADGRILTGTEAFTYGFVDELGDFRDAVDRAESLIGVKGCNLIEYEQHYEWSDFLRMFGKSEAKQIKVDLGFDSPRLQTGRLYFLAPMFAQ